MTLYNTISDDDLLKACAAGQLVWDREAVTYRVRGEDVGPHISGLWRHPSKIQFPYGADTDTAGEVRMQLTSVGQRHLRELEPRVLIRDVPRSVIDEATITRVADHLGRTEAQVGEMTAAEALAALDLQHEQRVADVARIAGISTEQARQALDQVADLAKRVRPRP